jgi:hypothetical protein
MHAGYGASVPIWARAHAITGIVHALLAAVMVCGCTVGDDGPPESVARLQDQVLKGQTAINHLWLKPDDLLTEPSALKCPRYHVLGVTVVLTARSDGTRKLWQIEDGVTVPAEPYLRNSELHPSGRDFVKDSLDIANHLFIASGACFLFDSEPRYVTVEDDILSALACGDLPERVAYTEAYLARKAAEETVDNPYRNRVIILYPWGLDSSPSKQGCGSYESRFVKMASHFTWVLHADGELVLGNNHLAHELGHFMGLEHPQPNFADEIQNAVRLVKNGKPRNLLAFPLALEYLPMMQDVSETELLLVGAAAKGKVLQWPYAFDQDDFEHDVNDACGGVLGRLPAVADTPADLGIGFPLSQGHMACAGERQYALEHYRHFKEQPGNPGRFLPDPENLERETLTFDVNDRVRNNIMSYWQCGPLRQRFSSQQVERMHHALAHLESRRNLIIASIDRATQQEGKETFFVDMRKYLQTIPRYDAERLSRYLGGFAASAETSPLGPFSALDLAVERASGDALSGQESAQGTTD